MAEHVIRQRWVSQHLPARPERAHKGTFGKVLAIAGSLDYAGAAVLCGLGAARAGAGLVCLATPESVGLRLLGEVPEFISMLLPEEAPGLTAPGGWRRLASESARYDAAVIGPGLGRQPSILRRTRNLISEIRIPTVVDADGLNALADGDRWWRTVTAPLVLTPHPGEFGRLTKSDPPGDDDAARAAAVRQAALRWGQVVVLKGAHTVVALPDGELLRSEIATPALSTAGSGDVLAGVIAAFLAGGLLPGDAAACGVAVHGAAGLLAEDRIGRAGVMARDIAALLPEAIEQLRGGRGS
ncbi:MAG: NAD(P)H-hydrate dehydratase [Chloroflexota bacterium]|nr:NAD(P)H-hydrate dehydratase [Chloroflexota bacterium]